MNVTSFEYWAKTGGEMGSPFNDEPITDLKLRPCSSEYLVPYAGTGRCTLPTIQRNQSAAQLLRVCSDG